MARSSGNIKYKIIIQCRRVSDYSVMYKNQVYTHTHLPIGIKTKNDFFLGRELDDLEGWEWK